eukprot:25176_1
MSVLLLLFRKLRMREICIHPLSSLTAGILSPIIMHKLMIRLSNYWYWKARLLCKDHEDIEYHYKTARLISCSYQLGTGIPVSLRLKLYIGTAVFGAMLIGTPAIYAAYGVPIGLWMMMMGCFELQFLNWAEIEERDSLRKTIPKYQILHIFYTYLWWRTHRDYHEGGTIRFGLFSLFKVTSEYTEDQLIHSNYGYQFDQSRPYISESWTKDDKLFNNPNVMIISESRGAIYDCGPPWSEKSEIKPKKLKISMQYRIRNTLGLKNSRD